MSNLQSIRTRYGVNVSFETHVEDTSTRDTPSLVLVHGGFSDHWTNWEFVLPLFKRYFKVYAIARRGRGLTDSTVGHSLEDEAGDAVELIETIGEPVFLLGHSYGAQVALLAASMIPRSVRKLILYEPPPPGLISDGLFSLESYARCGDWSSLSYTFFRDVLQVPADELDALKRTELWPSIVIDAPASLGDLRTLNGYDFRLDRFRTLRVPVLLQIGSESPRHLYATDALAEVLPDVRIETLSGQAHEGMTTAPSRYVKSVLTFLTDRAPNDGSEISLGQGVGSRDHASTPGSYPTRPGRSPDLYRQ